MALLAALRKEWLEQVRTSRLLVAGAVLLVMGLGSPLLARYTPEIIGMLPGAEQFAGLIPTPTVADAVGQYQKNMGQFGVVLALLLAMGSVAQEKERGTAALMLAKPLPRWAFLAAKFAVLAATLAAGVALAGAGAYYYTYLLFGPLDAGGWVALNALLLVFLLVYTAITLLCSVVARTTPAAAGLAFAGVVLLAAPGAIPQLAPYLPGHLLAQGVALALQSGAALPGGGWALGVSLGLIAAALAGAWLIFDRQEL